MGNCHIQWSHVSDGKDVFTVYLLCNFFLDFFDKSITCTILKKKKY